MLIVSMSSMQTQCVRKEGGRKTDTDIETRQHANEDKRQRAEGHGERESKVSKVSESVCGCIVLESDGLRSEKLVDDPDCYNQELAGRGSAYPTYH